MLNILPCENVFWYCSEDPGMLPRARVTERVQAAVVQMVPWRRQRVSQLPFESANDHEGEWKNEHSAHLCSFAIGNGDLSDPVWDLQSVSDSRFRSGKRFNQQ